MPRPHDADKAVPEQGLGAHFRAGCRSDDTGLQINRSVAERRAVLVRLLHEPQPHAGSLIADPSNEVRSEGLDEALAGPQRKRPHQPLEVELLGRAKDRFAVLYELPDPSA